MCNFVFIVRGAAAKRLGLSEIDVSGVSGPTLHNILYIKHLRRLSVEYLRQIRHLFEVVFPVSGARCTYPDSHTAFRFGSQAL